MRGPAHVPILLALFSLATVQAAADERDDAGRLATAAKGELVTVSGTVQSAAGDYFILDYGTGAITVEMDDNNPLPDNPMIRGDRVRVTGVIDSEVHDTRRTIEASSVYNERLGNYLYASPADEEVVGGRRPAAMEAATGERVMLFGTVMPSRDGRIRLSTGARALTIDTGAVADVPAIRIGDRLAVSGTVAETGTALGQVVKADSVRLITQDVAGQKPPPRASGHQR